MAKLPAVPAHNDLPLYADALEAAATQCGLPYELLVAQSMQESSWKLRAYRYEPNYDRRYVSGQQARFQGDPAWLTSGPTIETWFAQNPKRGAERVAGRNYGVVAQTRLAASYGPLQIMYPTALQVGYRGSPEDLCLPAQLIWPVQFLAQQLAWAKTKGWQGVNAVKVALAVFNGGRVGNENPEQLRNSDYVRLIANRYKQCWGRLPW